MKISIPKEMAYERLEDNGQLSVSRKFVPSRNSYGTRGSPSTYREHRTVFLPLQACRRIQERTHSSTDIRYLSIVLDLVMGRSKMPARQWGVWDTKYRYTPKQLEKINLLAFLRSDCKFIGGKSGCKISFLCHDTPVSWCDDRIRFAPHGSSRSAVSTQYWTRDA